MTPLAFFLGLGSGIIAGALLAFCGLVRLHQSRKRWSDRWASSSPARKPEPHVGEWEDLDSHRFRIFAPNDSEAVEVLTQLVPPPKRSPENLFLEDLFGDDENEEWKP